MLLAHQRTHGAPDHDEAVTLVQAWWASHSSNPSNPSTVG
jgi:hypothetical protein